MNAEEVVVYDHPLSPYAQKVKIALNEKSVPYRTEQPAALGSGATDGAFAKGSPRGEVPLLVHEDLAVFDSTIILEYIEDCWPTPPLLPSHPQDRARVRMIEEAMDTHMEAINWGLSEVQHFGRLEGSEAERVLEQGRQQLSAWFEWLASQLGDQPWFNGPSFGWGDLSVLPFVNGAMGFGAEPEDESLRSWLARANERSTVRPVVEAAAAVAFGSSAVSLDLVRAALEQGTFKREYRDHRLEWMVKTAGLSVVADGLQRDNVRFNDPFPVRR
ncbi:MAG: glutathione S-transferase family protein [Pseudomonadota bacterium]